MQLWKRGAATSCVLINWLRHQFARKLNKERAQLKQQEFAELIGISRGAVSNYMTERRFPALEIRKRIIKVARKLRIKLKMSDFYANTTRTNLFKEKIEKYDEKWWDKLESGSLIFKAYRFLFEREKIYKETGRYFKAANFPWPPWIPPFKINPECKI